MELRARAPAAKRCLDLGSSDDEEGQREFVLSQRHQERFKVQPLLSRWIASREHRNVLADAGPEAPRPVENAKPEQSISQKQKYSA